MRGAVVVPVAWNDEANEWQIDPVEVRDTLEWDYEEDGRPHAVGDVPDSVLDRASNHWVTADDLARMLGSAIVQPVRESNKYVEHRPANPRLIGILKDRVTEVTDPQLNAIQVAEIVQKILPIISSCDENAHMRGRAEALAEVGNQIDGGTP